MQSRWNAHGISFGRKLGRWSCEVNSVAFRATMVIGCLRPATATDLIAQHKVFYYREKICRQLRLDLHSWDRI